MTKSLYLKPRPLGFRLHSYYSDLLSNRIPGWTIISSARGRNGRLTELARQLHVSVHRSKVLWAAANSIVPLFESRTALTTADMYEKTADLTYCANHLHTRSLKWVVDCEHMPSLSGYFDPIHVVQTLARRLQEPKCKGLFCWSAKALENCRIMLGSGFPKNRAHILYPAVLPAANTGNLQRSDGIFRLLHVSTVRNSHFENMSNFLVKGTRDLFLILKMLHRSFPHIAEKLAVTVRAWCPPTAVSELRAKGMKLNVIHSQLSRPEVLSLVSKSDLVVVPSHSTPTMSFIEAMSRGIPVIANDVWANSEYVYHEKSGFLIRPPAGLSYNDKMLNPLWYRPGFMEQLGRTTDRDYLVRHLNAIAYLVEDESLLSSMKKTTMDYFERSEFNVHNRNQLLAKLLDGALG